MRVLFLFNMNSHKMACLRKRKRFIFFLPHLNEMRKRSDLHRALLQTSDTSVAFEIKFKKKDREKKKRELTFGAFVCLFSVAGVAIRADDR